MSEEELIKSIECAIHNEVHRRYRRSINNYYEYDDLVQAGRLGALHAARKYNGKGLYITYAMFWVRKYIREAINEYSKLKVSRHVRDKLSSCYVQKNYEFLDKDDVKKALNLDEYQAEKTYFMLFSIISTDDIPSKEHKYARGLHHEKNTDNVNRTTRLMECLNTKERKVVNLLYGINETPAYNNREVASIFSCSCNEISRIKNNALNKMNKYAKEHKL